MLDALRGRWLECEAVQSAAHLEEIRFRPSFDRIALLEIRDSRSIARPSRILPQQSVQSECHLGFLPDGPPIVRMKCSRSEDEQGHSLFLRDRTIGFAQPPFLSYRADANLRLVTRTLTDTAGNTTHGPLEVQLYPGP